MGNDTGAREPDGSLMFRDESRDTVTNEERLRARVRFLLAEVSAMPDWMRDEFLSGLAAGVGVPPGEARWLWFCSECGACEGDTMQPGCCRSCGSSAEGVRLKARFASDALAGVGEARPAEPPSVCADELAATEADLARAALGVVGTK